MFEVLKLNKKVWVGDELLKVPSPHTSQVGSRKERSNKGGGKKKKAHSWEARAK